RAHAGHRRGGARALADHPPPDGAYVTEAAVTRPLRVAFAGVFAGQLADRVRARVQGPCDGVPGGEGEIPPRLGDVDVLVSMAFTREMAAAAPRLRLVQVPGAGLDR